MSIDSIQEVQIIKGVLPAEFGGVAGGLHAADLALLAAVAAGAVGYEEGGRLARTLGGWQVISWALVLAAPIICVPVALAVRRHGIEAPAAAWAGFLYVAVISQFLGFFAWYRGLALGGVARVSQLQLLQPFLTLAASAYLLGEQLTPTTIAVALIVVAAVAIGRTGARGSRAAQPASQQQNHQPLQVVSEAIRNSSRE